MLAIVHWTHLKRDDDPRWDDKLCLYAYLHASRNWLLYVGKADYATVWQRYRARDKDALFNDIRRRYGTDDVRVLHGNLRFPDGGRRTSQLLSDVESLFIKRLDTFGNIQSQKTRISRPGMRVQFDGFWPFRRRSFRDL
jgi:hypothetical protein